MLLKEHWEISLAIPDNFGKIHIRGVTGMNAKLHGVSKGRMWR